MTLIKLLKFIYTHPFNSNNKVGGIIRFIKWQINCRLNPFPLVYPFTENSNFLMWKGLTGATGNLYCGLLEYNDMAFLLNFLRPSDLFVDIGANVGAYTILASAEIQAKSIAFEPVPATFKNLLDNISINNMQSRVTGFNIGLGDKKGILKFTKSLDTVNHVAKENETNTIEVEVDTLDSILNGDCPSLIKIDVEGFETEVLLGSENTLKNEKLKAIIIELNGSGHRYGSDENKIHENLIQKGFKPYSYLPRIKELKEIETYGKFNTIYLRDIEFVKDRIKKSRKIRIGNTEHFI